MAIAPEPILKAGLSTLHWATVMCRNWSLGDVPIEMVNDLMEAIHCVPEFLADWDRPGSGMDALLLHLSCFDAEGWRQRLRELPDGDRLQSDVSNLAMVFNNRLDEFKESI